MSAVTHSGRLLLWEVSLSICLFVSYNRKDKGKKKIVTYIYSKHLTLEVLKD